MSSIEKAIVLIAAVLNIAVVLFVIVAAGNPSLVGTIPSWLVLPTSIVSVLALVAIVRDLYLRTFTNPNSKLTWLFIIMFTGGVGMIVYVFRHAVKSRRVATAS